jgi:hypothetical protein
MQMYRALIGCLVVLLSQGCATALYNSVELSEIPLDHESEDVHGALTRTLISEGFDIKISDRDTGLVTTEFLQIDSSRGSPPFDWLLQLRCVLAPAAATVQVKPTVRESNRVNPSAYTEYAVLELDRIEGSANEIGQKRVKMLAVMASRYSEVIGALARAVGGTPESVKHTGESVELTVSLYPK